MKNIRYMLRLVWRADKHAFFHVAVYLIWTAVPTTISLLIYKLLIDAFTKQCGLLHMLLLVAVYILIQLLDNLIRMAVLSIRVDVTLRMRMEKLLNTMLLQKIMHMDTAQFDDPTQYDKIMLAANGTKAQSIGVFMSLYMLLSGIIKSLVGISVLAHINPWFIIIVFALELGIYFYNISFNKKQLVAYEELVPLTRRTEYFKNVLFQRSTAADIKQYASLGELLLNNYITAQEKQHHAQRKMAWSQQLHNLKLLFLNLTSTTAIPYAYVALGLFKQWFSIADMTVLLTSFQNMHSIISSFSLLAADLKESALYVDHLRQILDYVPRIETQTGSSLPIDSFSKIAFNNVSFRYPNSEEYVLRNISFTLKQGEKLALVGLNGAGKTTLIKLLLRFYDPSSGSITLDGRDIRTINVETLRSAVTTVFQDYPMYSLPLDELISCTEVENTDEKLVEDVLKRVGLWCEIVEKDCGVRTEYTKYFDEAGIVLSGGQLQKLAIARMLYKNSSILIMDEPSSSLDPESEYSINHDIMTASEGKTVLLISHRLSTTREADQILFIEKGELLEYGNHTELMKLGGNYAHLFTLQASGYMEGMKEKD